MLSFIFTQADKRAVELAQQFLEGQVYFLSDGYNTALTAYTLSKLGSHSALTALKYLSNMAVRTGESKLYLLRP